MNLYKGRLIWVLSVGPVKNPGYINNSFSIPLTGMLTRQKIKVSDLEALKKGKEKNVLLITLILPKKIDNEELMRQSPENNSGAKVLLMLQYCQKSCA